MALVSASTLGTRGPADLPLIQRHSDQSTSGANLTASTPSGEARRILFITVKYSAAATVNATVTLNSGAGPAWDTLLFKIVLAGVKDGLFIPKGPLIISGDDVIDVLAPLLAGQTSAIAIYSEVF